MASSVTSPPLVWISLFLATLILLYRVQTRRNLFQWLSLDFLQFLVPASFGDMLQTSRCRRLSEKIGVSSRAPKKWVDPRAQAPCRANSS